MGRNKLIFSDEDKAILTRASEIKKLLKFALKDIEEMDGTEFLNEVNELYSKTLKELLVKYNFVTLHEYCQKNGIQSFYDKGKLKYRSASDVKHHTIKAGVPIIQTLNSGKLWVNNYPKEFLDGLIPAMFGQPSIEYCS